jgi:putative ABC transport system permease protein
MTPDPIWKRSFRLGHSRHGVEEEVDDELRAHLEGLADRYMAGGMSEDEAWARVRSECGGLEAVRAELVAAAWKTQRRNLRREWMDGFVQDLGLSVRQMRKRPGFAALVILILGLGIGANSAIFSVLRSVVLAPLPYPEPDRLMTVWMPWEGYNFNPLSAPDWADLKERSGAFEAWGALELHSLNLSGDGEPEQVQGIRTSAEVFHAVGARAARGRLFASAEGGTSVARVAVISHGLWQRRFGSDPGTIGRGILINQESWTVIGVLPQGFQFPGWGGLIDPDIFLPISLNPATQDRGSYYLRVLGRLREGWSVEQARAELNGIAARLASEYPETNGHRVVQVISLREVVLGSAPRRLWILLGVTGLVLLLACANVAGLLVARNLGRRFEMAIRASLGAGRGRLIRQLLTEALTLALIGGGIGLFLTSIGSDLLVRFVPASLLRGARIRVDGVVAYATLAATLLTTVLAGVIPALVSSGAAVTSTLRQGSRDFTPGRAQGRLLGSMVVVQFALAFILVDGAGLMLQSLREATQYRELAEPERVLVAGYLQTSEPNERIIQRDPFLEDLVVRARALPGVTEAGGTTTLPLRSSWTSDLLAEGEEYDPDAVVPSTHMNPVSPGFFSAMGIRLLQGRDLAPEDMTEGALGVVVNETFATQRWPGESALGKRIWANAPADPWLEAVVVGVVEDVRQRSLEIAAEPGMYLPFIPPFQPNRWLVIRTAGDPLAVVPTLREAFSELDPNRPLTRIFTGRDLYESAARSRMATTRIFGIFALVALSLAAAGTFGIMSYFVGQKLREMGIRIALGARPGDVVWLVLKVGLFLSIVGAGVGVVGFWGVSGVLQSLLYGVGAMNPILMAGSCLCLGLAAVAAAGLPALRASRTHPVEVMKAE